jgi:hypothetical protein
MLPAAPRADLTAFAYRWPDGTANEALNLSPPAEQHLGWSWQVNCNEVVVGHYSTAQWDTIFDRPPPPIVTTPPSEPSERAVPQTTLAPNATGLFLGTKAVLKLDAAWSEEVAAVQRAVGPPDTSNQPEQYSSDACPHTGVDESLSWPNSALTLYRLNGKVVGYHYQGGDGKLGRLKTSAGIGIGSSTAEVARSYPSAKRNALGNDEVDYKDRATQLLIVTTAGTVTFFQEGLDCS